MIPGFDTRLVEGIELAERPGPGPAVVMLHGIGSNAGSFARVAGLLPEDWHLVAWNAPGYGRSDPLPQDWPLAADYAAALADLLGAMGVERMTLLGHSLGTLMGAAFAAEYPERVERLILASPALGHGAPQGGPLSEAAAQRIDDLKTQGPKAFANARAARLVHEPEANPTHVAAVERAMAQVSLPGYAQAVRMLASGRLLDDLARVHVPTRVVVGENDRVTPPETARRAHAALRPEWRGQYTEVAATGTVNGGGCTMDLAADGDVTITAAE